MTTTHQPTWRSLAPVERRHRYVAITDRLIHTLEQVPDPERSHVLYLDKSGRPVAWLVRALWGGPRQGARDVVRRRTGAADAWHELREHRP